MTDKKFTDDEIIKALEVCVRNDSCKECPINPNHGNYGYCTNLALTYALYLINRQKAEIEKLEKLDELAERSIEASTAVINDLRSEVALLNDANTNLQDLYQAEKSKVLKKQEKLIMAYRKLQTAKSEAIKEFAERLKSDVGRIPQHQFTRSQVEWSINTITDKIINGGR